MSSILSLIVALTVCAHRADTMTYYVVPVESINLCQSYYNDSCLVLDQLGPAIRTPYSDITVSFLPGIHTLTSTLQVIGNRAIGILFKSENETTMPTIQCAGTDQSVSFIFYSIGTLNISGLAFHNCRQYGKSGGALSAESVRTVSVHNCIFWNNSVHGNLQIQGGAISVHNSYNLAIHNCDFRNNQATCHECSTCHECGGGAVFVSSISEEFTLHGNVFANNSGYFGGAISYTYSYSNNPMIINSSTFVGNRALYTDGGAIHSTGSVLATNSSFSENIASHFGGAVYADSRTSGHHGSTLSKAHGCTYTSNTAGAGGALYTLNGDTLIYDSSFVMNRAIDTDGGAIYNIGGQVEIHNSSFDGNEAPLSGGALHIWNQVQPASDLNGAIPNSMIKSRLFERDIAGGTENILLSSATIRNSNFSYNSARFGGAMTITDLQSLIVDSSTFTSNSAHYRGSAIYTRTSRKSSIDSSYFDSNQAKIAGAIYSENSFEGLTTSHSMYINNIAKEGSAIMTIDTPVKTEFCHYVNNIATDSDAGGAIYIRHSSLDTYNNTFIGNTGTLGGAINIDLFITDHTYDQYNASDTMYFNQDTFIRNKARKGAAIYLKTLDTTIHINSCQFSNNTAEYGIVYAEFSTIIFSGNTEFTYNNGSVYFVDMTVYFGTPHSQSKYYKVLMYKGNTGNYGGAITCIRSKLRINFKTILAVLNNKASYGGGILLKRCTVSIVGGLYVNNNTAVDGAGIFSEQSVLNCKNDNNTYILAVVSNNTVTQNGGGLYLSGSDVRISPKCTFWVSENGADQNGGGFYLEQSSRLTIYKTQPEKQTAKNKLLKIANNTAAKGGGVYVSDAEDQCDKTELFIEHSDYFTPKLECFLQTIEAYEYYIVLKPSAPKPSSFSSTYFHDNTAEVSGHDIYGGLLDRCTLNQKAELLEFSNRTFTGLEYMLRTAKFDWANNTRPEGDISQYISSDPAQLCFCSDWNEVHCNYTHPTVYKKKGEAFKVRVIAVDQAGNPVPATIVTKFSSQTVISRLKEGQEYQHIKSQCTELTYNVYSTESEASLIMYVDGPCRDAGISKRVLNISLLPCSCPVGFKDTSSSINCSCDCDRALRPHVVHCSVSNETIQIQDNVWIEFSNNSGADGFVISHCPFDYCLKKPIDIRLNSSQETDRQCAYNRTGVLCGECEEGLSQVFASSICTSKCSHYYLLLLVPFALLGIALVVFILFLNITVAEGTINGLVLYANIMAANRSIFLPFDSPNFFTIFISWLNLDLGIETCFYDGMGAYGKLLLQIVFPAYVFVLVGIIIGLSEKSTRFTNIISRRKPIATLCTLILLSYSKLLRITITSLQFSILHYPDSSTEIVWLSDGNVPYFSISHIPRFILALVIIIIGAVYTTLLLFGQAFDQVYDYLNDKRSKLAKVFKWVSHPKYSSFIREYHAPLSDKHRYWIGFLLLVRIIHILVSSFAPESVVILAVGTIALGLIVFKLVNKDWQLQHALIYKKWQLDVLETSFLLNLAVVANATYFVQISESNQQTLAYLSLAISFVTFIGIVLFHVYSIRLVKSKVQTIKEFFRRHAHHRNDMIELIPQENSDESSDNEQYEEEIEPPQPYTDDRREDTGENNDSYHPGPIIRRAVPDNQLRENWMDDLLPVQPEDYNGPARPRPRQQQMRTFTEIDIRPRRV